MMTEADMERILEARKRLCEFIADREVYDLLVDEELYELLEEDLEAVRGKLRQETAIVGGL